MRTARLRNKLLFSAVTIGMVVALASMLAVSWVIRQQHLDQANALLHKASEVIEDNLQERKDDLLVAARQLATQKNLGSTIWYLGQYAQSDIDRETLLNTYLQLVRDTRKTGLVAKASKIAIYDASGRLVSFALLDGEGERAGFVERLRKPVFQVARLKPGEDLGRKKLEATNSIARMGFEFGGPLPHQESTSYVVVDGMLAIGIMVPVMGETFDPATGRQSTKQLGLVAIAQQLDQTFVDRLSRLTDTRINVFTPRGFSSGDMDMYRQPDWSNVQAGTGSRPRTISFNEIEIDGAGFYQSLIPLYADQQVVGTIAALYSKEIVQKNTAEMIQILGLIAAASLLLIVPFAWYFATSISRPLAVLVRVFRGVAHGQQAATLHGEFMELEKAKMRPDELGDLTQSFVAMDEAVNQKIRQINEINATLEQKVKERTAALAAKEQESSTLIGNSPDTIARYDRACRRTFVNPAFSALAPGGTDSLLGKTPSEFPGGANAEIYESKIREVFATGEDTQFELKWPGKEGREIYSHIRLTAEHDPSGHVVSVLGVGRDITELKEYQAELQSKELAKSRFLAAAGHDLRQPLAAANLFIDALKFTDPNADQNKIIQRLEQSMRNFNGLLDTLLNVSKLDAGMIKPEFASISVAEIFEWLEQSFAPMAGEKRLGLKLHFPVKEMLFVFSDIGLIKSVLMNLVSNAIKYTSTGGILIGARRRGEEVLFQVWDTGMGIEKEQIERIFDEFYQVNNPQRDRTSGLGLGLSIAKRALALLGGEITCKSRPGGGSVFEFRLPLDGARDGAASQSDAVVMPGNSAQTAFLRGKSIVVVEDDALVAEALVKSIEALGGKVECFHSAEDALQHSRAGQADYYIADYMLRGALSGIQFLKQLRQKLGKPVVAVLMTGDTSPAFIREAADCEWPVLHKPVNISGLIASLGAQVSRA